MTERVPIHIYCIAFGTRKYVSSRGPVGQEVVFYSDGRIDDRFANLKDIYYQAQEISYLSADKSAYKGMEDMASFTGAAYKTAMGTLYYYIRRAMHTNVGRASSYGQIVIYKKEDLTEQDSFIKNVLGFHFLTEDQITGMEEHPLSQKEVELADEVLPVNLRTLSEARRNSLCRAAELLLKGQKVMLRLPDGAKFVSQCQQILVELFTLLPDAVRSDISFSTCRKSDDFYHTGNIQLLIVDKDVAKDGRYELIEMDAGGYPVADCIQKWCMESAENRSQINDCLMEEETIQGCLDFLKRYYNPAEMWWAEDNPPKRFTAYADIKDALDSSPVFCTRENWESLCYRIPKLLTFEGETGKEAVKTMMVEECYRYRQNGGKEKKWLELAGRDEFQNGLYKLGLSNEEFEEAKEDSMKVLDKINDMQEQHKNDIEAQQTKFASDLKELQANHEEEIKRQKEQFDSELKAEKEQLALELQEKQRKHDEEVSKSQEEKLNSALNEFTKTLNAQKDAMEKQSETLEEINRRLGEIESGREDTNARLNFMGKTMEDNQKSQNTARQELEKSIEGIRSDVHEIKKKQDDQQKEINNLKGKKSNPNPSEGGGGNQTAMIAAIGAGCLALILLVVFVVMAVKYVPVIKEAEIELKATPAPTAEPIYITAEPTEAPTPEPSLEPTEEPSLEPTETPAFTPVPDELQKYLDVCAEFELKPAEDKCEDEKWVYENDWASVEICLNPAADVMDAETAPMDTPDSKTAPTDTQNAKTTPNATVEAEAEEPEDENVKIIASSAYTLTIRKLEPALEEGTEAEDKAAEMEAKFQTLVEKLQAVCSEVMATPAPTAETSLVPASEEKPAASSEPNPT